MTIESAPRKYAEKEAFVTGHDGTTPLEIFFRCLVQPISIYLFSKLTSHVSPTNKHHYWIVVAIEFAIMIMPCLFLQTSLLPDFIGPSILHAVMSILSYGVPHSKQPASTNPNNKNDTNSNNKRPPFFTVHRATTYIQTAIAILAVDFPIFPRRYCKTEVSGYGWMDLGAATFVIIAGWSSASDWTSSNYISMKKTMKKVLMKCAPLLILGVIRLVTIKGVEYQEHVSEYGVHWNFFFTLCCVEGIMVIWKYIKGHYLSVMLPLDFSVACFLMIIYQLYLSVGGGQDFMEDGPRQCAFDSTWPTLCNVFFANREGILGIVGYLCLRLLSESMARYAIWPRADESTITIVRQRRLLITSVGFWAAHFIIANALDTKTSRRSTNVSFILWALAQNASGLCLNHFAMTSMGGGLSPPPIHNCINRFGLPVFFVSNIFTGLVNLLVDTIHSSDEKAILVLSIYLVAVCVCALLMDKVFQKKTAADKKID